MSHADEIRAEGERMLAARWDNGLHPDAQTHLVNAEVNPAAELAWIKRTAERLAIADGRERDARRDGGV